MAQLIRLKVEPNTSPKKEAFAYQNEAVAAIKDLVYSGIFHEQGLGKTKIAIDLTLSWLTEKLVDSIIIVTKKGLIPNWIREFKQHTHIVPVVIGQDRRSNFYAFNAPARIYLIHYEAVVSEFERVQLLQQARQCAIILDEAHKIKNPEAKVSIALHGLSQGFVRRVIMTGTPIANRVYDIWSQIYFLDRGVSLGTNFPVFKRQYDLPDAAQVDRNQVEDYEQRVAELYQRISPFTVRETKAGAGIVLPSKEFLVHYAEWETVQGELYRAYRDELGAIVVREGVPVEDNAEDILKRLVRLTQIASNPVLVDEQYDHVPGKFHVLESLLADITNRGEKAIVWTSFTENADWLYKSLKEYSPAKVHGKMNMEDREKSLSKFMDKELCQVLVATPGAAKEGLTLTVANHVIFYDRTFSLDDYLQAQDRIHRISQEKTCYVHNIFLPESVDEWVDAILSAKQWSAKLGQGDVTLEEYRLAVTYQFHDILRNILRLNREEPYG